MTGLKAKGGVYHVRSANSVKELPAGSVPVPIRSKIVGKGVVTGYLKEPSPGGR